MTAQCSAGLGPPAGLPGVRQGVQAAANPALLRPTHSPSSLSKAIFAPAACLVLFPALQMILFQHYMSYLLPTRVHVNDLDLV